MLTDRFIKSTKPKEKERFYSDYDGLYLRVGPINKGGGKTWRFRFKNTSKSLGKYPEVELAEVRDLVREIRKQLAKGLDPFQKKHKELEVASDFIEPYAKLKGLDLKSKEIQTVTRNINYLINELGDRPPHDYSKIEINSFVSARLLDVSTGSIRRELNSICAVFNLVYEEHEIDHFHRFRKIHIPREGEDKVERDDFTPDQLEVIREIIKGSENKVEQIIGLLIDTGMRSSEAVGLASADVHLGRIPHIVLHKNTFRRLKTKNSQRKIPLVGSSLDAANNLDLKDEWVFSNYIHNIDSANASVNNRLKRILGPESPTSHSFRHTLATRLRSVECPEYMRKELGGWASSVSEMYGTPTDITSKAEYIEKSLDWITEIL